VSIAALPARWFDDLISVWPNGRDVERQGNGKKERVFRE